MINLAGTNAHKAFVSKRDGFVIDKTNERAHIGLKYRPYVRPIVERDKKPKGHEAKINEVDALNGRSYTLENGIRRVFMTPDHPQWANLPEATQQKLLAKMNGGT